MTSLAEYTAGDGERKTRKCKTCNLPKDVLEQVEAGRKQEKPVTYELISRWLRSEKHDISMFNLRNHFQAGHDEDVR